jgi:uncharacterized membrane protein
MEKLIVIVFDKEATAYEGLRTLNELDREGSISLHELSVVEKKPNGTLEIKNIEGDFPVGTFGGTAVGSLIGLFGGPVGVAVGASVGALVGFTSDLYVAEVDTDFLDEVAKTLTPGKFAIVADISEEWVTPLDTRMDKFNAFVVRTPKVSFEDARWAKEVAGLRAEIAQMQAELKTAHEDRKAKIRNRIDTLDKKLQARLAAIDTRAEQIKRETDAKVEALQRKAAKAHEQAKTNFNARITEIRHDYEDRVARLRNATATHLRKTADKIAVA